MTNLVIWELLVDQLVVVTLWDPEVVEREQDYSPKAEKSPHWNLLTILSSIFFNKPSWSVYYLDFNKVASHQLNLFI